MANSRNFALVSQKLDKLNENLSLIKESEELTLQFWECNGIINVTDLGLDETERKHMLTAEYSRIVSLIKTDLVHLSNLCNSIGLNLTYVLLSNRCSDGTSFGQVVGVYLGIDPYTCDIPSIHK